MITKSRGIAWIGCLLLCASALAAGAGQREFPTNAPIIDATVATIPMGTLPDGVGVQGVVLNADRSRLYVSQAHRTTRFDPSLNRCQGGGGMPQPGTGGVGVFDTTTLARTADLRLADGFPIHVELDPSTGRIYAVTSPDWVYAFEGTTQVLAARLGGVPHDIGIDHTNGRGVVTNTAGPLGQQYVTTVNLSNLQTVRQADTTGFGPHKAAVDPERHLAYVSHADFAPVSVIDTTTGNFLRHIQTGLRRGGAQNAIDLTRRRLYVVGAAQSETSAEFRAINLATEMTVGAPLPFPFGGHGMRVDPITGFIWMVLEEQSQVSVIDPDTLTERARVPVGHCPYYLDIDPVRRRAYVTNQGDNTVSVVDMTRVPSGGGGGGNNAPSGLTATSIVGNNVSLSWTAPTGSTPTGYVLEGGVMPGQVLGTVTIGAGPTQFSFTMPTGTFYLRLRALYGGVQSEPSNEIRVLVNVTMPPSAPTGLAGQANGSTLALTWQNTSGGGAATSNVLNVSGAFTTTVPLPLSQSFSFTGVPPGTYTFTVSAVNAGGTSGPSNAVTLTFPSGCTLPTAPANFSATRSDRTISLSWDPPASGGPVVDYLLSVSGSFVGSFAIAGRSISGTVGPGSYTFRVAANSACGAGPFTASQTVVVP